MKDCIKAMMKKTLSRDLADKDQQKVEESR